MAFCVNCGNQLNEGERFCTNCGTQVAAAPPRPVAPPAPPAPPPRAAQQETPPPTHSMGATAGGMGVAAGGTMGGAMGGGTGGQPPQMQHAPMQNPPMEQMPYQAVQQQTGAYDSAAAGQPPSAESIKDMFFSYRGRLNRKPFILRGLLLSVLSSVMSSVMTEMTEASSTVMHLLALLPLLLMVVLSVGTFMLIIRRWHDLGKSGWLTLLMLIPLLNFLVLIFLWVKKGTDGPNAYGDDPLA